MMKKITAILLALAMVFALAACSSGTTASEPKSDAQQSTAGDSAPTEEAASNDYTIGVFTKDGTIAFWRYCMQGAKAAGERLGVTVKEYAPQSYTDVAGQITMIEDAIQSGVDAICVAACDSTAILPALEKAHEAGIVVICFNTRVPDFQYSSTFVGVDNVEASRAVVAKYLEEVNYTCNMAVIEGDPAGQQNIDRTQCLYEFAEQYEGVNLVAIQPGYANREQSMTVMENILQSTDDIDVVWAISDVAALGAAQAIEASGRDIPIFCIDGTPEGAAACLDGRIYYTYDQSPLDQGGIAVECAVKALNGETLDAFYPTGGTIVSAENAKDFLATYYPEFEY